MGYILSDSFCDGFGDVVSEFLKDVDWHSISSAINFMALATPCSSILLTALRIKGFQNQRVFSKEMTRSVAELKSYISNIGRKMDRVLQADMEAGLMALQSATSTEDDVLSQNYLSNAVGFFMRAVSQEQNTRKVQAVFNLGLCQFLQGDPVNAWSNFLNSIRIPYVESNDESKSLFLQNRQNVQNSLATVIQEAVPIEERNNIPGLEGAVCNAEELYKQVNAASEGAVIKLFPTQYTLEQPSALKENISLVPLFPEKTCTFVSALSEPIVFQGKSAVFEKIAFIRNTPSENADYPFFCLQNKSPIFNNCTFLTKQNGISIYGADSNPEFNHCLFVGASSTHVFISEGASGIFNSCEFESGGTAIALDNYAKPLFKNCWIHNVNYGAIISENANARFNSCDFFDFHTIGITVTGINKTAFEDCKIHANKHEHKIALQLYEDKANVVTNSIKSARKGFSFGLNKFNQIKTSFMGSSKTNEPSVPLVIEPSLDDDDPNNSAVGLFFSNGSTGTFIKCSIYGTNANIVYVDEGSRISFTECAIHNGKQNGVFVTNGAIVNLQNCTIENNSQDNILVYSNGTVACTSCRIFNAGEIGIHCVASGECKFTQCQVSKNKSMGFLLENYSMASVDKCVISQNNGFGVTVNTGAGGNFTNNELSDNKTLLGSGGAWNLSPDIGNVWRNGNNPNE